jgi:PST family polysaccharide transporter
MIKLGVYLSLVSVFTLISTYVFQIFLRGNSNLSEVGFYQAAFVILNTYVGLVFNALRTDYFPRLSQVHDDNNKLQDIVLQQARVTTLLITPVAVVFIVLASLIITILYSSEFLVISGLLAWAMLGVGFKSASFTLGYVILAKNDSKLFLRTSLSFNIIFLLLSILGYKSYGLDGIGIAYLMYFLIHFIGLKIIVRYKYNIRLSKSYVKILILAFILCLFAFLITFIESYYLKLILNICILIITSVIVYKEINKLIDIKKHLINFWKKKNEVN